jgi:glycosyltransferase involved in cell wall biosynthesis
MASGTPVITSDSSCLPETVGEAALLISDNNSVQDISAAMETLLTDKKTVKRLVAAGLSRAAQFSWDTTAQQTLDALAEAMGSRQ